MPSEHSADDNQSAPDCDQSNNDVQRVKAPTDIPKIMESPPLFLYVLAAGSTDTHAPQQKIKEGLARGQFRVLVYQVPF